MKYQIIFNEHPYWEKDPEATASIQSAIADAIEKEQPVLQEGDPYQQSVNNQLFAFTCHLTQKESFVSGENYQILDLAMTAHP